MIQHSISTQAMSAPDTPNLRTSQSHSGKSVTVLMPSQIFASQTFQGNATTRRPCGASTQHVVRATGPGCDTSRVARGPARRYTS